VNTRDNTRSNNSSSSKISDGMKSVHHLEIHVAHACNLTCESCSHYSNQGHKGLLSVADAEQWMALWAHRINPKTFSMLGGEPSLHPQLPAFVELARRNWPDAHLRLVTNGFFLHRHPDLPAVLKGVSNAAIYWSIHHDSPEYRERLAPIFDLLQGWVLEHGIRVETYRSYKTWTRRYLGEGAAMQPFADGQPRQSWEHCPAKTCPQIYEGKIWKCAPLAYLGMQDAKYGLSDAWKPYLAYQPLDASCSDEQLTEFFEREEEPTCGMCPAKPKRFELPMPLRMTARVLA